MKQQSITHYDTDTMDREQLLKDFLGLYPDSTHPYDRERFLKYALACAMDGVYIDTDTMVKSNKVTPENIEKYEIAYEWIRDTFDFMIKNLDLGNNLGKFLDSLKQ